MAIRDLDGHLIKQLRRGRRVLLADLAQPVYSEQRLMVDELIMACFATLSKRLRHAWRRVPTALHNIVKETRLAFLRR